MKKILLILLFFPVCISAQTDTLTKRERNYLTPKEYQSSVFYVIQQAWAANRTPSTASVLFNGNFPLSERRVPLAEDEGDSNLYLLEADMNLSYPLINGRKEYGSAWRKLTRLSFDYGVNFRMVYDHSSPVTPPSQKVGLSITSNVYNNYSGRLKNSWGQNSGKPIYELGTKNVLFLNLLLKLYHYSNGQSGGSTYTDPDSGLSRNNYRNGDFSTNFFYAQATFGKFNTFYSNLNQLSLGYRRDWGKHDWTFSYLDDQVKSYGKDRISIIYDFRSSPRQDIPWHFRTSVEYLAGSLQNFQANLNDDNKYRLSGQFFFALTPKFHRSVGYFISGYVGRDYLNIRYDDIVFVGRIGLSLSLDGYTINKADNVLN